MPIIRFIFKHCKRKQTFHWRAVGDAIFFVDSRTPPKWSDSSFACPQSLTCNKYMHGEIKQNFIKNLYKLSIYTAFIRLIWRHGQRGINGPTSRSNTRYYEYILWRREYRNIIWICKKYFTNQRRKLQNFKRKRNRSNVQSKHKSQAAKRRRCS